MQDTPSESKVHEAARSEPGAARSGSTLNENDKIRTNVERSDGSPAALSATIDPATTNQQRDISAVLHVGCGAYAREKLPAVFRQPGWREIRLDIDPEVEPDFVASMTDMSVISEGLVDAVYSSHNVEHLYPHEVPGALAEMLRVLRPAGFAFIVLPDLQEVSRHVAEGRLEDPLYLSPMGPISALDIMFGHRPSLAGGNMFMAHRTGFTNGTLAAALIKAGFAAALVQRNESAFLLTAIAFRSTHTEEQVTIAQATMLSVPDKPAIMYTAGN
jgi:hypothetical protein